MIVARLLPLREPPSNAMIDSVSKEFFGVLEFENLQHAVAVRFDGSDAQFEIVSDLLIRFSVCDKTQELDLPIRKEYVVGLPHIPF